LAIVNFTLSIIFMKVLIIAYYWPPSGGSGVQRWLKFVKYLPQFGVTPYVFTPENPSFDMRDESLLKDVPPEAEVIHFPIWEPYALGKKVSGQALSNTPTASNTSRGFLKSAMTWIRGNIFFPDPRIFWVRPSVKFLDDFLRDSHIDIVITTGPPHSVHFIGQRLRKRNPNLKWIADFRDPWSEWGMLQSFKLTSWAKRIHQRMERKVLTSADRVVTITPFYLNQLQRLSWRSIDLITNGFDNDDFKDLRIEQTKKFVIRHIGVINPTCDPKPFMNAVKALAQTDSTFAKQVVIIFTGQVNADFESFIRADKTLNSITTFQPSVPHHEVVKLLGQSSLLLLVLTGYKDGEGFLPGKLFEYFATGLPIMSVGPVPSDAGKILNEVGYDPMVTGSDTNEVHAILKKHFNAWQSNCMEVKKTDTTTFSRKQLTFKLVELLKSM
jgi:glycosyltransferase involved in cell wall biosynthesis